MYINQIFELSMTLDNKRFQKIFKRKHKKSIYAKMDEEEYIDESMTSKGITVIYRDSQYKKKIKLIIDPGLVSAYLKVLKRIGRVKGFSKSEYDCFEDINSFCLEGNSNDIGFWIYDLEEFIRNQLGEKDIDRKKLKSMSREAEGILRTEVRLMKPKAVRCYTETDDVSGQIAELVEKSSEIFLDVFTHIIPYGDYYKKNKAVEIVREKVGDSVLRRRMLRLLELIPEKKSLYLAQKAMNCRNVETVMEGFAKINLSPVTISKRHDIKFVNSLYSYLR